MGTYSNPQLPQDEINVSEKRPLAEFLILAAGLFVVVAAGSLLLMLFAQTVAAWLPFSAERAVADRFFDTASQRSEPEVALQRLADALVGPQGLPPGVTLRVHYKAQPVANATATVGGHVTIYQGLIESIDSENALALVLAHEIGHVRHRDPVQAIGRGLALAVVLSAISAGAGSKAADWLVGNAGTLTALSFSRSQEARADADALAAVAARYGHVAGAGEFFTEMQRRATLKNDGDAAPSFMRTHPATDDRLMRLDQLAIDQGWPRTGPVTPLPEVLAAIRAARKDAPVPQ